MVEVKEVFPGAEGEPQPKEERGRKEKKKGKKRKDGRAEEWMETRRPGANRVGKF